MRILSGTDIVDLKRIEKSIDRLGDAFINKCFTSEEAKYCDSFEGSKRIESFGARFAAKEACSKALGTGILAEGVSLKDIEVLRDGKGRPSIRLTGRAQEISEELGVFDISVSLSHDGGMAIAMVSMLADIGRS